MWDLSINTSFFHWVSIALWTLSLAFHVHDLRSWVNHLIWGDLQQLASWVRFPCSVDQSLHHMYNRLWHMNYTFFTLQVAWLWMLHCDDWNFKAPNLFWLRLVNFDLLRLPLARLLFIVSSEDCHVWVIWSKIYLLLLLLVYLRAILDPILISVQRHATKWLTNLRIELMAVSQNFLEVLRTVLIEWMRLLFLVW